MRIKLDYGVDGLWVDLPSENIEAVLSIESVEPLEDPESAVLEALRHPISSSSLAELAEGRRTACVVISDITRPVPNRTILPPILRTLEGSGIPRDGITILIATGIHRPNLGDELVSMVGDGIVRDYRIVNHLSREKETMKYLGETSCGAPIFVDSIYLDAELKITTALIEPHLMAGYSGGRKAICPGICGLETMKVLHGPEILSSPRAMEGVIDGNPFHEQSLEVAKRTGVDFILNVAMDERRRITGVFAGDLEAAHEVGMKFVEEQAGVLVEEPVDVVVTTGAGYPLDLTFYQAIKGMTAALPILRDEGTIVIASCCAEGLGGPEFSGLLRRMRDPDEFLGRIYDPGFFVVDQWQVQELCKVLKKARVLLYSEGVEPLDVPMVELIPSVEDGVRRALKEHGRDARIAVIPKGPYVLPAIGSASAHV